MPPDMPMPSDLLLKPNSLDKREPLELPPQQPEPQRPRTPPPAAAAQPTTAPELSQQQMQQHPQLPQQQLPQPHEADQPPHLSQLAPPLPLQQLPLAAPGVQMQQQLAPLPPPPQQLLPIARATKPDYHMHFRCRFPDWQPAAELQQAMPPAPAINVDVILTPPAEAGGPTSIQVVIQQPASAAV